MTSYGSYRVLKLRYLPTWEEMITAMTSSTFIFSFPLPITKEDDASHSFDILLILRMNIQLGRGHLHLLSNSNREEDIFSGYFVLKGHESKALANKRFPNQFKHRNKTKIKIQPSHKMTWLDNHQQPVVQTNPHSIQSAKYSKWESLQTGRELMEGLKGTMQKPDENNQIGRWVRAQEKRNKRTSFTYSCT